jgi:hypothetical protein
VPQHHPLADRRHGIERQRLFFQRGQRDVVEADARQ